MYDARTIAPGVLLAGDTTGAAADGWVLLAGGEGTGGAELASIEIYDPEANEFLATDPSSDLSQGRMGLSLTGTLSATYGAVAAGGMASPPANSLELFDAVLKTWTASGATMRVGAGVPLGGDAGRREDAADRRPDERGGDDAHEHGGHLRPRERPDDPAERRLLRDGARLGRDPRRGVRGAAAWPGGDLRRCGHGGPDESDPGVRAAVGGRFQRSAAGADQDADDAGAVPVRGADLLAGLRLRSGPGADPRAVPGGGRPR